jgi:predicted peptidase
MKLLTALLSIVVSASAAQAQSPSSSNSVDRVSLVTPFKVEKGQKPYEMIVQIRMSDGSMGKRKMNFFLYLPDDYGIDKTKKWPLLISLHGSYQTGNEVFALLEEGLARILMNKNDFPFIVISPQLPSGLPSGLSWNDVIDPLRDLIDKAQSFYSIDPNRISVTGFSMGGFGTWQFALQYPDLFSAIVPIAGGYKFQIREIPNNIESIKHIPTWVFHGSDDTIVFPYQSTELVNALKKCGGNPKITIYEKAGHVEAWGNAYADPALFDWLLKQKKK